MRRFCCTHVGRYNDQPGIEKGLIMRCIRCGSEQTRRDGHTRLGGQRWRCNECRRRFTARSKTAFAYHGFLNDVRAVAVRHSVRYRLSYADVVAWFAERGLMVDRSTMYRWVQRFLPLFAEAALQQLLLPVRCDKLYPLVCRFAPTFGVCVAGCVFRTVHGVGCGSSTLVGRVPRVGGEEQHIAIWVFHLDAAPRAPAYIVRTFADRDPLGA